MTMIELDSRRRASLKQIAQHERYLVDVEDDGTIVLTPAVVMSAVEAQLMARKDILDSVDKNRAAGLPGRPDRPIRKLS